MNYAEIEKLLERGFTPEQIMELQKKDTKDPEPAADDPTPAPAEPDKAADKQDEAPAWAASLTEAIASLKRSVQASALAGAAQNEPKNIDDAAAEALASIIAPTYNKEGK